MSVGLSSKKCAVLYPPATVTAERGERLCTISVTAKFEILGVTPIEPNVPLLKKFVPGSPPPGIPMPTPPRASPESRSATIGTYAERTFRQIAEGISKCNLASPPPRDKHSGERMQLSDIVGATAEEHPATEVFQEQIAFRPKLLQIQRPQDPRR